MNPKSLVFFSIIQLCFSQNRNNVCKNFADYSNLPFSRNCWYDPDVFATPEQIAHNHGFEFQNHKIETEDGYYLTIFRIQDKFKNDGNKPPILLHHGLGSNAMSFLGFGNQSLAFYLARNGFDVWLANHRGNNFSKGHARLKMSNPKFWDFSFHEMAIYDIPAVVEFIAEKNGNGTKIIYVGHSMGTTIGFIYASLKKEHAEKFLKGVVALAPTTSLNYGVTIVKAFKEQLNQLVQNLLQNNITVMFPAPEKFSRLYAVPICVQFTALCLTVLNLFGGRDEGEFTPEYLLVGLSHHPGRTSLKCFAHYLQFTFSQKFEQYDYGVEKNLQVYKSQSPPIYPLSNISIPVHLFYGLNDPFAGREDVESIYNQLKMTEKSINVIPENGGIKLYSTNR
ncbi:Lipase 1-like Protein [Tribolium castaneum]|uniref:Lipase n=1 Tax=Tribolium castaneum TaxID=7070 RepID=D6X0Z3_TRICA|nr:Lipase 1-like Protein [Tribolium castaneum]